MTSNEERRYDVWLGDRRVGVLTHQGDDTWFVFEHEYLADEHRAVLGLQFEEDPNARFRSHMRLPPWFSNLLPEGRLRDWIAEARGVSAAREMELLAEVGHDLPGAVRVLPADGSPAPRNPTREISTATDGTSVDPATWRFSLAGVQLKFSMLSTRDRFSAPASTSIDGDWIVKLPDPKFPRVPANEFAMMRLAKAAGIDVPDIRLVHRDLIEGLPDAVWPTGEEFAFAIRRFDRAEGGVRIHIEDLAQVRGVYPGPEKYQGTFETVASLIYRRRDAASAMEFARRLAFNVLIKNGDAHLKNWSLIYRDPRVPQLAPAYDLVATSVYLPGGSEEDLGLKFGGSRRFEDVSFATFQKLQEKIGLGDGSLATEAEEVVRRAVSAWPDVSSGLSDDALRTKIDGVIGQSARRLGA